MREIVRARHVLLEFNGRDVLNISELFVAENERIGLIGANGSGKTSLLRILSGPFRRYGDCYLHGCPLWKWFIGAFHNLQRYLPMGQYSF